MCVCTWHTFLVSVCWPKVHIKWHWRASCGRIVARRKWDESVEDDRRAGKNKEKTGNEAENALIMLLPMLLLMLPMLLLLPLLLLMLLMLLLLLPLLLLLLPTTTVLQKDSDAAVKQTKHRCLLCRIGFQVKHLLEHHRPVMKLTRSSPTLDHPLPR